MKTFIFFDLEATLIPDWFEDRATLLPLKHPQLADWIFDQPSFTAGLLSFAVGEADMPIFNTEIRPNIENHLHFKFDEEWILTNEKWSGWLNDWNKTPWESPSDNIMTHKKFGVMHAIWRNLFTEPDTTVILLDDTVEDMVIERSTFMPLTKGGNFTHTIPVTNNRLICVNPWTIIRS